MAATATPVVFIHGLWLHADSWSPWVDLFREHGYSPVAPGWPGDAGTVEETRSAPDRVAGYGIDAVVEEYARAIDVLARAWRQKPIVIGHSFGGLIVQRLLGENKAVAGVAIDPAPIKGVALSPAVGAARRVRRASQSGEPEARCLADAGAVPLRVRQRALARGIGRALRALDDPFTGQASVRGRHRQLQATLAGEDRHEERRPRSAAPDGRRQGPHRPAGGRQGDVEALPGLGGDHRAGGVPRPRALARDRQRLAGRRGNGARLARQAGPGANGTELEKVA